MCKQEQSNHTVLIVDDDACICDAVTDILELADIQTMVASNGLQGLNLYKENSDSIDLVILDLMMPIMDGETTLRELQAYDPTVNVLMASGSGNPRNIRHLMSLGAINFLHKPYDLHMLLNAVDKGLQHKHNPTPFRACCID